MDTIPILFRPCNVKPMGRDIAVREYLAKMRSDVLLLLLLFFVVVLSFFSFFFFLF